jgi:hypothetical protein
MAPEERQRRSRLTQIVSQRGLLHATLLERQRKCGKEGCRCTRGELHQSLYLAVSENGRTRQLYVPKDWEPVVRRWVEDDHRARQLMDEISRLYWEKVRTRKP